VSGRKNDDEEDGKKICVLFSTCPPKEAERLAGFLVEKNYAACVNIIPAVTSIFRWEGKVERDSESLLVIKCAWDRVKEVTEALLEEHPYDVAEVIALEVKGGNPVYLSWVLETAGGG
jgi:periplasmic divalent cation tolerance protein